MSANCAAFDLGASSGRLILGSFQDGTIKIKEIHRFKNSFFEKNGSYFWDTGLIFAEMLAGMEKLGALGAAVDSMAIDTWGVDYAVLDAAGDRVFDVYSYRDHRTDNTMDELFRLAGKEYIFGKTGLLFAQYNTIFQLYEHIKSDPAGFKKAKTLLMLPDYLSFLFSGVIAAEYTEATTTQLINIAENDWDADLLRLIGADRAMFPAIVKPGTALGGISDGLRIKARFPRTKVIAAASHDTASAVVSAPLTSKDSVFISSGTWSVLGFESEKPLTGQTVMRHNFSNEGGAAGVNLLKNIIGLWLIQEVQRILGADYSIQRLVELAEAEIKSGRGLSFVNPDNPRFLNPDDMAAEIKGCCAGTGQAVPGTPGEIAACVFASLAMQYRRALSEIEDIRGSKADVVNIVGGGSQNGLLNQLCADYTGCAVHAGPVESSALGNIAVQLVALGEIASIREARRIIADSFEIRKYSPNPRPDIERDYAKFVSLP